MYFVSKLFLNSLYGRFAMSPYLSIHKVIDLDELEFFVKSFDILDIIDFENGKLLISYNEIQNMDDNDDLNPPKVSVVIASAITAYSRITMSPYIRDYQDIIHSIDTDGVKYSGEIDSKLIGPELGQMKHEGTYSFFF
jgi:hypothetical protein